MAKRKRKGYDWKPSTHRWVKSSRNKWLTNSSFWHPKKNKLKKSIQEGIPMSSNLSNLFNFLQKQNGGLGVLIGGTSEVPPIKIGVIGAGSVGYNAAIMAYGMQADVYVFDIDEEKLKTLKNDNHKINTVFSSSSNLDKYLPDMDVIINGIYIPGASAPKIINASLIDKLKNNCLIIDVAIDQGGSVEYLHPTSHDEPLIQIKQIYGYAVPNMPGVVPRTASKALNEATFPYIEYIANHGINNAIKNNNEIANGVNTYNNKLTTKAVADSLDLEYTSITKLI